MTFQAHSFAAVKPGGGARDLWLHLEHARLSLLRGFDELLCLEGLTGVEHLPHQIETVRRVLRQFRGRVLLADEVGLGKTIEACLLLREYVLRSLVKRVLILVPAPLVSQWQDELHGKFHLDFTVPPKTAEADQPEYWSGQDRVLMSLTSAKAKKRSALVAAQQWDLVIVDEAHHCKNRATLNWQVVNSLQRRFMFLLTATPVQNNLVELYNLLTLLAPGHLKTEADFKKQFVTRGNPRDPRNRERLRTLLGEVMVRNTRSLVNLDLPPRYAQTIHATPGETEALLYLRLDEYLRRRGGGLLRTTETSATDANGDDSPDWSDSSLECSLPIDGEQPEAARKPPEAVHKTPETTGKQRESGLNRMQLSHLLAAQGSHPSAVQNSLENMASPDDESRATRVEYHQWTLHARIQSDDMWESLVSVTFNSASGALLRLPDLAELSDLAPIRPVADTVDASFSAEEFADIESLTNDHVRNDHGTNDRTATDHAANDEIVPPTDTEALAIQVGRRQMLDISQDFIQRIEQRLERDRKRVQDYYRALTREAAPKPRKGVEPPSAAEIQAKKNAVGLEQRRKLGELTERYSLRAELRPLVLLRVAIPALALPIFVQRKQASRTHTLYWNPLLKKLEPLRCTACSSSTHVVHFTNDTVEPQCSACFNPSKKS